MKIIKTTLKIVIVAAFALIIVACSSSSSMSYTFDIESNGDIVKIELDTSKGHILTQDGGNYFIYKKEKAAGKEQKRKLADGYFILADQESWQILLNDITKADMIKKESVNGEDYYYFAYGADYYCCGKIADSNTAIKVISESEKDLNEAMSLLTASAK